MTASELPTVLLVRNKTDEYWTVISWDELHSERIDYGIRFSKPLENVPADDHESITAMKFMAAQMNIGRPSANFWIYTARNKLESGGRLEYAKHFMQLSEGCEDSYYDEQEDDYIIQ